MDSGTNPSLRRYLPESVNSRLPGSSNPEPVDPAAPAPLDAAPTVPAPAEPPTVPVAEGGADAVSYSKMFGGASPAPSPFVSQLDTETRFNFDAMREDDIYRTNAHLYRMDPFVRLQFTEWVEKKLAEISAEVGGSPSVTDQWRAIESNYRWSERPMRKYEFAATKLAERNLSLRRDMHPYRPATKAELNHFPAFDPDIRLDFSDAGLAHMAQVVHDLVHDDDDAFIIIDTAKGRRMKKFGTGKSTLAIQVAQVIAAKLDTTFDLRRDVMYGNDMARFDRMMNTRKPYQVFIYDEGRRVAYRRGTGGKEQRNRLNVLAENRENRQVHILPIGHIGRSDFEIYDGRATHRIKIVMRRKRAIVYEAGDHDLDGKNDEWGHPLFALEWEESPEWDQLAYKRCRGYTKTLMRRMGSESAHASPLDEWIKQNRAEFAEDPQFLPPFVKDKAPQFFADAEPVGEETAVSSEEEGVSYGSD